MGPCRIYSESKKLLWNPQIFKIKGRKQILEKGVYGFLTRLRVKEQSYSRRGSYQVAVLCHNGFSSVHFLMLLDESEDSQIYWPLLTIIS